MREIKFRAWDKTFKKMTNYEELNEITKSIVPFYRETPIDSMPTILIPVRQKSVELLQYTGLKDKNGKEIYEGDICKLSNDTYYSNHYFNTLDDWEMTTEVVEEDYSFKFRDITDKYASLFFFEADQDSMEIEVIGNIYENPELLDMGE